MQQQLINRFRGLFLGVAVAEACLQRQVKGALENEHAGQHSQTGWGWHQALTTSTAALINAQPPASVLAVDLHLREAQEGEFIASMLPLALFWQDNLAWLEGQIRCQILTEADSDLQISAIGMGVAIALICQEQVSPKAFIPRLLTHDLFADTGFFDHLNQVQRLLETHASLAMAWHQLRPQASVCSSSIGSAIAMGFYCWLSTAEAYPLTLSRSLALPQPSALTVLVASSLSGLFNGVNGISLTGQIRFWESSSPPSHQDSLGLADQLMALWSGYHHPQTFPTADRLAQTVVSAPGVLRPRTVP